jgi:MFS family permease
LSHNLRVLSLVSLFQDTASELLYPILPIFLVGVLGAPVAVVGLVEGLADGAAALTKLASGRWSDRRSRRPVVAFGYGLAAAAKVVVALAVVWPMVLAARVADRIGKGIRGAPRDALIADDVDAEHRGRAYGFHRSLDTAGAVLGPLIGLGLYEMLHHHIRPLLWVAAIPALVSVSLVSLVRERPRVVSTAQNRAVSSTPLPPQFWRLVTLLGAFAFVNFSDALLLIRAQHLGLGVGSVIGVYCLYNLTYALASYPAGVVSDKIPRRIVVGCGLLIFAVAYIGLGVISTSAWVWVLFPVYGLYTALTDGVTKAWVVDLAPDAARGRAIGVQGAVAGAGAIVAGLWAGLAWSGTGRVPLIVAGSVAAIISVVMLSRRDVISAPSSTSA